MADLNELKQLLVAADLDLSRFEMRSSRELRVAVPREKLTHFADYLRALTHARPELIVAEDTRQKTAISPYVIFSRSTAPLSWSSPRSACRPGIRTFPSLATRWYLASRFEREIHDCSASSRQGIPIYAVCPCTNFGRPIIIPVERRDGLARFCRRRRTLSVSPRRRRRCLRNHRRARARGHHRARPFSLQRRRRDDHQSRIAHVFRPQRH